MRRLSPEFFPRGSRAAAFIVWWAVAGLAPALARGQTPHTFDGRHSIATIDLSVVYLVPKDRTPLADWRDRVDYFMKRIDAFHRRESNGKSSVRIQVRSRPLIVEANAEEIRGKDPNDTFFNSTRAARKALNWPAKGKGFPILLVLSDINWRELDDFQRTRVIDGIPVFEGNIDAEGRHFPGAESGGARAMYVPEDGTGVGLVSADGWRVPYSGSDCVVYHEGVGHAIGLPHPEPIDDSVMGTAQYKFWINQAWIDRSQKVALGWVDKDQKESARLSARKDNRDLFTAFTAVPVPALPRPDEPVSLKLTWPERAKLRSIKLRVQTNLRGPWTSRSSEPGEPPTSLDIGAFDRPTPVSYRVDAVLKDGQSVELWGYFQVKKAE